MKSDSALKKLTLLYVEDEVNLARLMEEAIAREFGRFLLAHDGEEGLSLFRKSRPDIVVTDITMPGMDGLAMASAIRRLSPETPVVVLSAYSDKEKLLGAIDTGVRKYFIKPFDPEELLEYLKALAETLEAKRKFHLGESFLYDRRERRLYRGGEALKLTTRELKFIEALLDEPGHILDSDTIRKLLWKDRSPSADAVRVFIMRLREKTSKDFIRSESGRGYSIEVQ